MWRTLPRVPCSHSCEHVFDGFRGVHRSVNAARTSACATRRYDGRREGSADSSARRTSCHCHSVGDGLPLVRVFHAGQAMVAPATYRCCYNSAWAFRRLLPPVLCPAILADRTALCRGMKDPSLFAKLRPSVAQIGFATVMLAALEFPHKSGNEYPVTTFCVSGGSGPSQGNS